MHLTSDERDLLLVRRFELAITHEEDDGKRERCKVLAEKLGENAEAMFFRAEYETGATMSSTWRTFGRPVCDVVSVLFTSDRRVFFGHDDGTIRQAADWERDEVLLQMLSRRDSFPQADEDAAELA